jgi:hypothetical protein
MLSAPAWIAAANDSGDPTGAMISKSSGFMAANLRKKTVTKKQFSKINAE